MWGNVDGFRCLTRLVTYSGLTPVPHLRVWILTGVTWGFCKIPTPGLLFSNALIICPLFFFCILVQTQEGNRSTYEACGITKTEGRDNWFHAFGDERGWNLQRHNRKAFRVGYEVVLCTPHKKVEGRDYGQMNPYFS